jgi:hypothetical protein
LYLSHRERVIALQPEWISAKDLADRKDRTIALPIPALSHNILLMDGGEPRPGDPRRGKIEARRRAGFRSVLCADGKGGRADQRGQHDRSGEEAAWARRIFRHRNSPFVLHRPVRAATPGSATPGSAMSHAHHAGEVAVPVVAGEQRCAMWMQSAFDTSTAGWHVRRPG